MARKKSSTTGKGAGLGTFCTSYRHSKTGKTMRASDYGLKAFYFPAKNGKKGLVTKDDPIAVSKGKETKSGS